MLKCLEIKLWLLMLLMLQSRLALPAVLRLPLWVPLPPTDPTSVLNAAFKELGYVNEDGLKLSHDASDDKIKVWGGVIIRTIRSDYSATISGTLLSTLDVNVLKNVFGDSQVAEKSGFISIKHDATVPPGKGLCYRD